MHARCGRWVLALLLAAAPGIGGAAPATRAEVARQVAALAELGRAMFTDPSLSASGRMSCASCHSPEHAFGPPDGQAVRAGGADLAQPGLRAVPSLRYLQAVPQFAEHYFESEDEADESVDNGPTGGLTWDGRVDTAAGQAAIPLLSSFEMANAGPGAVVARMRAAPYAAGFRALLGPAGFDDDAAAFAAILKAFEVYQQDWRSFYPYSSKYDAVLAGRASLTAQEARGLALFDDPAKGNCAECHPSRRSNTGEPPQFTDYGLIALGVPRNPAIPANRDPGFFDMGLCGPLRTDLAGQTKYCGMFRTPTLRNVATRQVFFHNGVFHTLREVMEFYVRRDTDPERWYPRRTDGTVEKFDDLPAGFRANVNIEDAPLDRGPGDQPALDDGEIDDVIAFMHTLTDGYFEPAPKR